MTSLKTAQAYPDTFSVAKLQNQHSLAPVRVLFFNHTGMPGGAEIAMLNLIRHLDAARIKPCVVFGSDGPIVEQMREIAETHVLPLSKTVGCAQKDAMGVASLLQMQAIVIAIGYIWRLARLLRQNDPDFVHTNSLKAHLLGGFAAILARKRVVWHLRNSVDEGYLPSRIVRKVFRFLARCIPAFIVTCSAATLRSLSSNEGGDNAAHEAKAYPRAAVVHDGTVLPRASREKHTNNGRCRVALIGRISPWKGQHVFIRAASIVRKRFPSAEFFIVGASLFGEENYEREVRELAKSYGAPDLITFMGFRRDVLNVIAEMDVIVHASTIGEPFGQVIIEGMAAGKPVIATNGGGVPEIVEDGSTGILVPMGDYVAMAAAMARVLGDPSLAADMGRRGRKRVQDYFTIDDTARKIEAVYASMQAT